MKQIVPGLFLILLLLPFCSLWAQELSLSNWRSKTLSVQLPTQVLDSLSVIPATVDIFDTKSGKELDTTLYQIADNSIHWAARFDTLVIPKVDIRYRVFPYAFGQFNQHLDTTAIRKVYEGNYIGYDYTPYEDGSSQLKYDKLNYNGSFARGVAFGNNQSLTLNSSFNLQMAGTLGDDVEILAAITDNNIPLQPEGNTQQLQEFDKIFIQIKKDNNTLIAGDYELQRPHGYFMNYYKKLQGATYSNESKLFKKGKLNTKGSVAIARGKFARNTIAQQEGNQGPYRLRGNEGEVFIIILAGTEKVFLDGQLLKRGLDQDYVIDYNRGDITFTNKRLITKDSRIIIEFEYADQSYLRSMYAINTEYQQNKLHFYLNFFSQQDSKNSSGLDDLSDDDKLVLSEAGDDLTTAFVNSIDTLEGGFNENVVMYVQRDTTFFINNLPATQSILIYSTDREKAEFVARFADVGAGNGNYVLDTSIPANGRVYRWVAPNSFTGEETGNFEPIRQLSAPIRQQMLTVGGAYQLGKQSQIKTEVALSNYDLNRFSTLDKNDNVGLAFNAQYSVQQNIGKKAKRWQWQTDLNYEWTQADFKALNPYRSSEFVRDWNISTNRNKATEHLGKANFVLKKINWGSLQYTAKGFFRDTLYTGYNQIVTGKFKRNGYEFYAIGNWLTTASLIEKSDYSRPKADISKTFKKLGNWTIGSYVEREKNSRYLLETDTLSATSFYWDLYRFYANSPSEKKFQFGASYTKRFDFAPTKNGFEKNTRIAEANIKGQWLQAQTAQLKWNFTYRNLEVVDATLTKEEAKETYLGQLDYALKPWKGSIRSNTTYGISSGQEPKIEYNYLEVPAGEGFYVWNGIYDTNGDSIPQINEFVVSPYQDEANYIRVTVFTNEFIRTNNVQFNQSLRLEPKVIWHQKKGIKKIASRFSTQSTFKINRKVRQLPGVSAWNPFQLTLSDSALVAITSNIQNRLYFNRAHPKFELQIGLSDTRRRLVLSTGFESQQNVMRLFKSRWNLRQKISTQFSFTQGMKNSDAEIFDNKRYNIDYYSLEPQLTFLPAKDFRAILKYRYQNSENTYIESGERAINHNFNVELTYNRSSSTSIRLNLSYANVSFDGEANTPLALAMLEGLQNGKNYLWNLTVERRLSQNIQLSVSYEGRKTGMADVVHVGRAQVRASF